MLLLSASSVMSELVLMTSFLEPPQPILLQPHLTCAHTRTCHRLRLGPVLVAAIAAARGRDNLLHGRKPPCPLATTTATTRPAHLARGGPWADNMAHSNPSLPSLNASPLTGTGIGKTCIINQIMLTLIEKVLKINWLTICYRSARAGVRPTAKARVWCE